VVCVVWERIDRREASAAEGSVVVFILFSWAWRSLDVK
jgi:hypothetical protein